MGSLRLFFHLVFQAQEIPRWNINDTQSHTMFTWRNATMGGELMGNLSPSGKLDKSVVTISHSKYTLISKHIN